MKTHKIISVGEGGVGGFRRLFSIFNDDLLIDCVRTLQPLQVNALSKPLNLIYINIKITPTRLSNIHKGIHWSMIFKFLLNSFDLIRWWILRKRSNVTFRIPASNPVPFYLGPNAASTEVRLHIQVLHVD